MFIPFIVGLSAVFLTFLTRRKQNGIGLKLAFFVIFVFLALRYDYGNDYMAYLDGYNEIASYSHIFLTGERFEPGWRFLHVLFKPFGFFAMVAFTSLTTCVVFYWFIRSYVPAKYQWLAVFLYVFDPYQILVPASAMRQNVAILLFLIAIKFLHERRIIIYLLLTIAGTTFHKSAMILPPLVLLAFINIKINKFVAVVIGLIFASLFWFGPMLFSYISPFIGNLTPQYAESYLYYGGTKLNTGLGFIYSLFQLIAVLYFAGIEFAPHTESPEQEDIELLPVEQEFDLLPVDSHAAFLNIPARRLLFKVAIITFMITPVALQAMMFSRMNLYFAPVLIVVFPIILFTTKDKFFYIVFLSSLMAFTLFRFWAFFLSPVWRDRFGTYQTIFSAPQWF
ncbi:MAG: EpsG family protein [Sedimentisphaerales bacterium]